MQNILRSAIAAAVVTLLFAPAAAHAQLIDVRLNPRIGLYEPLSSLGEFREAGSTIVAEQSGSLALGLGAELSMALLPVNVRLNLDYATGSEVRRTDDGIERESGVESTLLAVVADVLFRPLPSIIPVQPYFFLGGGLKQYDFEVTAPDLVDRFRSGSDPTLHLGGGVGFKLGAFELNAEVSDYISRFELEGDADSKIQHDLFATIGFSIGLF